MNKYIKISIRNLCFALFIVIFTVISVETVLAIKNIQGEDYYNLQEENSKIMVLQVEHSQIDKIFMSATNVYNIQNMYTTLDLKPELKAGYPLIEHITDKTQLDDALNIVVIGDSFVWGAYSLNRNELFWRILENDFRKEGINVNVFGVGATGANAYEELSWLMNYSLIEDIKPDLVIFGYVYNDSDDSVVINSNEVNWYEELPLLSTMEKALPNISRSLIERISAKTMYTDKYSNSEYVSYDCAPPVLKGRFYEKYKTDFVEKLDNFAATVDFPIAVVTLPTVPNNILLEELYEPLDELYSDCKNISYYNSVEQFNEFSSFKHRKNYSVNIADFHPGSATNRFYADYIRSFIETDFPQLIESAPKTYRKTNSITINDYLPYRISPVKTFEDEKTTIYEIEYPSILESYKVHGIEITPYCLYAPLGQEHIKISFSDSINISEVKVDGCYNNIELYYTCINPKLNYDDHSIYRFDKLDKNTFTVDSTQAITSVLISADFDKDANKLINLEFKK